MKPATLSPIRGAAAAVFISAALLAACGSDRNNTVGVSAIEISPASAELNLNTNKTIQLTATVLPANASNKSVKWESTNASIASVDQNGLVTARGIGGPVDIFAVSTTPTPWVGTNIKVTVSGLELSTYAFMVPQNYTPQTITASLRSPSGAAIASTAWSSSNAAVAAVNASGTITFGTTGSATVTCAVTDTAGDTHTTTCAVSVYSRTADTMQIGNNLWNLAWGPYWDYTRAEYLPPASWALVTNPWVPGFLTDLGSFNGPIRFMDFGCVNELPIIRWQDRNLPTDNFMDDKKYPVDPSIQKYYLGADQQGTYAMRVLPYEWMIDLCNRTGHDMWVCVPTFSDEEYWTELAKLINTRLDPNLRCYVEYSNETWNGMFKAYSYSIDQGMAMGASFPGDNQWYKGGSYSVYRSLQIFKAFVDVFGASNTGYGKRLIRVLSAGGNGHIAMCALRDVVYDGVERTSYTDANFNTVLNPHRQKADLFALRPMWAGGWMAPRPL